MDLDRALELAVVASWDELVDPGEACSIHVEYVDLPALPVNSLEVWKIKNRGYGTLVCRYSTATSNSSVSRLEVPTMHFAYSYRTQKALANNLDFILRNQHQLSRASDRSIHGLVQVDLPLEKDRESAKIWSREVRTDSTDGARHDEHLAVDAPPGTLGVGRDILADPPRPRLAAVGVLDRTAKDSIPRLMLASDVKLAM